MKTKRQYLYNALLLTAVTLLMRTVSVGFNVYVSNRVGAEAMGLLSLVSGVYGFATTFATSGIHLATVRTVAERLERSGGAENKRCLFACLSYAAFFGTLATILLFLFARPIGELLLREVRTVRALQMLAFTLLPIALTSVLNGYFTAVRRAWKNAMAQVVEQAVKISFTGYLLVVVAPKTVEGSMLAILMGGAVSESLSLLLNIVLYLADKRHFRHADSCKKAEYDGKRIPVAAIAMPVAISAYMRSGLLAIEHILIPRGLTAYGAGNSAALAAYGSLHSMALPVVLYPAAILSSFASLLIPEMTEQQSIGNKIEIRYIAGRVYQMTLLFSIGVSGVMLFLSSELGGVLYDNAEVSHFIRALAPLVPIMYLDTATDAMLKGLGQQVYSMNVNIIDALVSVICVAIFVPRMGINGYLLTIYISEILNAALSVTRLLHISGFRPRLLYLVVRPLLSVVGATSLSRLFFTFFPVGTTGTGWGLTLHITITALLYFALLYLTGGFGKSDARWLIGSFLPNMSNKKKKNSSGDHRKRIFSKNILHQKKTCDAVSRLTEKST
ncbi:MAG: polysaccharide biosynthesis C-terminal domain-containing protein [Clostridia bacterium]|nr:polysaccharide biosynthesis C-terminal domain-containing protein [Clostridia bacterium]